MLAPWDRNPMLERLEENRILHLIARLTSTPSSTASTRRCRARVLLREADLGAARAQPALTSPPEPAQRRGERQLALCVDRVELVLGGVRAPARSRWRASSPHRPPPRRAAPAASSRPAASPTPGMRPSHFSATLMWASIQPPMSPIRSSEWWWITLMSCGHHLPAGLPGLQADVEVVAVELAQPLVEAQLRARPRATSRS